MIQKCKRRLGKGIVGVLCLVMLGGTLVACDERESIEVSPNEQVENEVEGPVEDSIPVAEETDVMYRVERRIYEDPMDRHDIEYPQISGFRGELLQDYMNQSLRSVAETYADGDRISAMQMNYALKLKNNDRLSVLFSAQGTDRDGRDIVIRESVNLDIRSSNEILFENLIKKDAASQEIFSKLIETWSDYQAEQVGLYFEEDHVVFFKDGVLSADQLTEEFRIPNEEIMPIIRQDFGPKPAS